MAVAFRNVTKVFPDGTVALDGFELTFETGEFVVLLGPSGSGKTTACRILAGLEPATSGRIEVGGRDITDLPPRERGMSMVFQNYALYAHKSVYDNIAYPLRVRGVPKQEIDGRVRDTARLLQIDELMGRRPGQLSGGQAQRVAVARALVWQPDICLMDEPLSNLDAILRLQTRTELKRLHAELKTTFVFVTHDQEEAMTLGTRIAVLKDGSLVQFDTPREIYHRPASRFVAEFIGRPAMNVIDGAIAGGRFRADGLELALPGRADQAVGLGIRPEHILLHGRPKEGAQAFRLDVKELVEPDMLLFVRRGALALVVRTKADLAGLDALEPGAEVHLELPGERLHLFDAASGLRQP
ncbi:MAG: ABC transporter ATP-binding protein [Rhodospirillales bacterium]|nr:ABC transporter ATP-binding protein [Rhodospirillales bacterium]MDH3792669.1 ABC transporter ATP-binding protein [Rhodospirillales bacterium]MDH3913809.1 ABC transporter ATP-binding protein [Rhodospirillales bacterium]MDH3920686.1 ABC transporter ATP-binding protein [Rhodospirillales bacterium]MDH3967851.1 ABC transporter ATP-binding protein [Rhodospirillales bacterium]